MIDAVLLEHPHLPTGRHVACSLVEADLGVRLQPLAFNGRKCIDARDRDAAGAGPEALYAEAVIVPPSAILDLNGFPLYARAIQISGTVISLNTVPVASGGTNITSYTTGDLLYASATTTLTKLALGTQGYVLQAGASGPTWGVISGGTF